MRELQRQLHCFGGIFDWDKANLRLEELDAITSDPALWEKPESAQALMRERTLLEKKINDLNAFLTQLDDIILLIEISGFNHCSLLKNDYLNISCLNVFFKY